MLTLSDTCNMEREEVIPASYPSDLLDIDWSKRKCFYLKPATEFCRLIHEFEVLESDVWIITLPKCGTTWMQELTWLVMNNFDFVAAKAEDLDLRSTFLELDFVISRDPSCAFETIKNLKPPRLIKSHLPLPLLPKQLWQKKPKVIYVYRNPKDTWVSLHYHILRMNRNVKSVEKSIEDFIAHTLPTNMPFHHVTEFYQLRHEPWIYYTSYERMKLNLTEVIRDVCQFLGKVITEQQMQQMLHHLSFEEMKKNPTTNHIHEFARFHKSMDIMPQMDFIRKGKVNGHKDDLSPEFIQKVDRVIAENLKEHNLKLKDLLLLKEDNDKVY